MDELEEIRFKKMKELMKGGKNMVEIEVTDATFKEKVVEKSKEVPVVVDFWAPWCGPCRMISPVLEKLAKEYDGKFILAKMNVDENQLTATAFGIMSIPTVMMFKNGEIADKFIGALPEPVIRAWIEKNIKG